MVSWNPKILRVSEVNGYPNHQLRIQYIFNLQDPQILRPPTKTIGFQTFSNKLPRGETWQEIAPEMVRSLTQKTPDLDLKYLYLAILRFGDLFWNKW